MSECRNKLGPIRLREMADFTVDVVGFFLVCEDFGRIFDNLFLACAFFVLFVLLSLLFCLFVCSFLVGISSRTLIPLFRPGSVHNGSAS